MATFLEIRMKSQKVIADQLKIIENQKKHSKAVAETTQETKKFDRAAERLKQSVLTPQEKHNKSLKEMTKLYASGRINVDQLRRGQDRLNRELHETERRNKGAFGSAALQSITSFAGGIASAGAGAGILVAALREVAQQAKEAAEGLRTATEASVDFFQLSGGGVTGQQLKELERNLFTSGAFSDRSEAQNVVRALASAGITDQASAAVRIRSIEPDAAAVIGAYGKFLNVFGREETGSLADFADKTLAASKSVTGVTARDIATASLAPAALAKGLEVSDEAIIGLTQGIAATDRSSEQAGTKAAALVRQLIAKGFGPQIREQGLPTVLEDIRGRGLSEQGLQSLLGSSEAVAGFNSSSGLAARIEALRRANADNALDSAVGERFSSSEERTVQRSRSMRARLDISRQQGEGLAEMAIQERQDAVELVLRESGAHGAGVRSFVMRMLIDALSTIAGPERVARGLGATDEELQGTGQTEDLRVNLEQMNRHLQQISDNTGRSTGTAPVSVTTDDEN